MLVHWPRGNVMASSVEAIRSIILTPSGSPSGTKIRIVKPSEAMARAQSLVWIRGPEGFALARCMMEYLRLAREGALKIHVCRSLSKHVDGRQEARFERSRPLAKPYTGSPFAFANSF